MAGQSKKVTPMDDRLLMTRDEAAARVNVHPVTLARWGKNGAAPKAIHIVTAVRYDVAEFESWVAAGCPAVR